MSSGSDDLRDDAKALTAVGGAQASRRASIVRRGLALLNDHNARAPSEVTQPDSIQLAQGGHPTAIVVEDDDSVLRLQVMLLERWGVNVVGSAGDGPEGVDLALRLRPNIVLMNGSLPTFDGFDASARILAKWPQAQIVMCSAWIAGAQSAVYEARASAVGIGGTLGKPFSPAELLAVVQAVLGRLGFDLNAAK